MVNKEHLAIIKQGVPVWNEWRDNNHEIKPDLSMADLSGAQLNEAKLMKVDLKGANLSGAYLSMAYLWEADLSGADLSRAHLIRANLREAILDGSNLSMADFGFANLRGAFLRKANLYNAILIEANLSEANLNEADIRGANLTRAILIETSFENATLTGCDIYGISAWNLKLQGAEQSDLIITPIDEPTITIDNLEVAQFIYLLLNNEKLRDVINTITSKVVLILGRFGEHKAVLDTVRNELRKNNYLPIMFDFKTPANRDMTETVRILAHLARFIIADITEPRSIPQELQAIIPDLAVPVQPLLLEGSTGEYAMFQDLRKKYHWVLETCQYRDLPTLLDSLKEKIIDPAEVKAQELEKR